MEFLGIALIIITVMISVHVVYEHGKKAGMSDGRREILQENLHRAEAEKINFDKDFKENMAKIGVYT